MRTPTPATAVVLAPPAPAALVLAALHEFMSGHYAGAPCGMPVGTPAPGGGGDGGAIPVGPPIAAGGGPCDAWGGAPGVGKVIGTGAPPEPDVPIVA